MSSPLKIQCGMLPSPSCLAMSASPSLRPRTPRFTKKTTKTARTAAVTLPIELWTRIIMLSSDNLEDLCIRSAITSSIRDQLWWSTSFHKACLLAQTADPKSFATYRFLTLPDGLDILRWLIRMHFVSPTRSPNILMASMKHLSPAMLKILTNEGGFKPEADVVTHAAGRGDLRAVNILLSWGVHASPFAVTTAAYAGHAHVVKELMSHGIHPQRRSISAAAKGGHAHIVNMLLRAGVRPWPEALTMAARYGHADIVVALLEYGLFVDPYTMEDAIEYGRIEVVQVLIDYGVP
ncbi:hypothetical protein HDU76_011194, partial [Blyttiomyces sp. JEL0837]